MDDFLVFRDSFKGYLYNLEKVLSIYEEASLVLNQKKYHFVVDEGIIVGYKILAKGIEVDHAKIKAIKNLNYLTNIKGVRSFLYHAGFYKHFIKNFTLIGVKYAAFANYSMTTQMVSYPLGVLDNLWCSSPTYISGT